MMSVAITLPEHVWERLTDCYACRWQDAEDDLDLRELTSDERIAAFVADEVDGWCDPINAEKPDHDLDGDAPL